MANKLDKYAEIQAMVQKDARSIAEQVYDEKADQYGVAETPHHEHNGIDSPSLPTLSIEGAKQLPGTSKGIVNENVLGGQEVYVTNNSTFYKNPLVVPTIPIPFILGSGTTSAITLTSGPSAGDTSASLTSNWGGTSGSYGVAFSTTEVRDVTFTNGSAAISWSEPLKYGAGTSATVIANSRFKGGDAPIGTIVSFRNDDDNIKQLWIKTVGTTNLGTWIGIDADYLVIGYE